jgi:predicted ATPase
MPLGPVAFHPSVKDRYFQTDPLPGFSLWLANATVFHGWALAASGEVVVGVAQIRHGFAARQATRITNSEPYFLGMLADARTREGNPAEALALLAEALTMADRLDKHWFEAELLRLKGEALLRTVASDAVEAEACFRKAIDVAREQGAHWWELRAAISLARLWAEQSERRKAEDLLSPVYGWFTEGFDTPDLREARALLDALQ